MANNKGFMVPRSGYRQMIVDTAKKIAGNNRTLNAIADDLAYDLMGGNEKYTNIPSNNNNVLNDLFGSKKMDANQARAKVDKTIYGQKTAPNKLKYTKISKVNPKLLPTTYVQPNWTIYDAKNAKMLKNLQSANAIGNVAKGAGKFATEWLPGISDVADIYMGYNNYKNADTDAKRALAIAQMVLGVGGLATLGVGSGAKALGKLAVKGAISGGAAKKLIQMGAKADDVEKLRFIKNMPYNAAKFLENTNKFSKNVLYNKWGNPIFSVGSQIAYNLMPSANAGELTPAVRDKYGRPKTPDKSGSNPTDPNKANSGSGNNPNGNGGYGSYGGGYKDPNVLYGGDDTSAGLTNDIVKAAGDETTTDPNGKKITDGQPDGGSNIVPNAYDVLDEWRKKQEIYDAYRNSFINYRNNYRNLYEQTYARNKALEGMKDFGNPSAGTYTSSMSPLDLASNEVALDKTIADEMVKPYDDYKELIGNIALSKQIGLPPEVMYTDPKRFDSATDYMRAKDTAELNSATKQYVVNQNNATKLMKLQLDKEIARAKLEGDWRKAQYLGGLQIQLHAMDNAAGIQKSLINTAPWYTDMETLMETLAALGIKPQQTQQTQQVQPTNRQTVRANVSVQATPGNKDAILGEKFAKYSGR